MARSHEPDMSSRPVLGLVNTCGEIPAGVRERPGVFEAAIIFGAGFAPFLELALHDAQARGLPEVRARLEVVEAQCRAGPDEGRCEGSLPAEWRPHHRGCTSGELKAGRAT